jgi:hypothetical protein
MTIVEERKQFGFSRKVYESAKLTFHGVEGFDVYNTSIPFRWNGQHYLFGRVERRGEWARSWVRLFTETGKDDWSIVPDSMIYQLEDPFVSFIGNILVLGGTHVRIIHGDNITFNCYFYRGADINDMYYFATGPDNMKDARLVQMTGNRIGVFSRPRDEETHKKYGSGAMIGFTIIDSLDELTGDVIEGAAYIEGIFDKDEWGACNQAYQLDSGLIGIIGHKAYCSKTADGQPLQTYLNISMVFDPVLQKAENVKVIGTRVCYPAGDAKRPQLADCAFTSGIVMREDGRVDLYSGIGDCAEGRIVIDYPFEGYGRIVVF